MVNKMKKGFTLIELLIVVVIVGILALAAIPLITSNTRDARRAEGEQLLGSQRDWARVEYSKTGSDATLVAAHGALIATQWTGKYFTGTALTVGANPASNVKSSTGSATDGTGTMTFAWQSGSGTITWNPV